MITITERNATEEDIAKKKKDIKCLQKNSIREDRLAEMIDSELKKYTILPEFRDWALDVLKKSHKGEVEDRK